MVLVLFFLVYISYPVTDNRSGPSICQVTNWSKSQDILLLRHSADQAQKTCPMASQKTSGRLCSQGSKTTNLPQDSGRLRLLTGNNTSPDTLFLKEGSKLDHDKRDRCVAFT